ISPLIGCIIFFHVLTPLVGDGLPLFSANDSFLLWLAGRYVMAFAFFMAIALLYKKDKLKPLCIFYILLIFVIFSALLLYFKPFPVELIAENDPLAAYIIKILAVPILLILLISLFLLILVRKKFDIQVYRYIFWSIIFTILSENFFFSQLWLRIDCWQNIFGHFFGILSYYLIFKAIVDTGIKKPFDLIFRELKLKEEQLKNLAITDELTGVLNRRAAFEILEKLLMLAKRNEQPVSICFVDIDDLKLVNDTFGHSAGDELLSTFAAIIGESVRESDFICRLGGDEFLIILPDCSLEDAENLVGRIKERVEDINNQGLRDYRITFSYGLAFYDYHDDIDADGLLDTADKNMYINKENNKLGFEN
ncbi:MAG: GGDEF domain-containing protein, partial [Clostridia bacterium]|nr:GGDEF domain-containing protein [Clostridia bacterium]